MPNNFERGDQVRYIPTHAHDDPNHPDCETGIVTASYETEAVMVRYFRHQQLQSTPERTNVANLVFWGDPLYA